MKTMLSLQEKNRMVAIFIFWSNNAGKENQHFTVEPDKR